MIQFDSMGALDDHDNAVRQAEQERIIKLLEDFDKENASCQCCFTELCVNDAIALIKGEK